VQARYINELTEGGRVDATFLLRSREMRAARTGDAYLALTLADRTGSIPAVLFRPRSEASAIPAGSVVRVRGVVTSFRGVRRVSVDALDPAAEWDPADLLGSGTRSQEEMRVQLAELVRLVGHPGLGKLLRVILGDKSFMKSFSVCPASQSYHHAYVGGLLEHTISVAATCADIASRYDGVDKDLLVTAALLHDIGKVDELSFSAGIGYTDTGRLVGHVVSGVLRVRDAASRTGLELGMLLRLEHALLSHHGELEWGSPKRPSTFEALLLHHVDNLDAKAAGFSALLQGASLIEESWTDAGNLFRRPLYAPRPAEDDRPDRVSEDDQHHRLTA
jgi:3'-5' exoribonuclease